MTIEEKLKKLAKLIAKQVGKTDVEVITALDTEDGVEEITEGYADALDAIKTEGLTAGEKKLKGTLAKALSKAGFKEPIDKFDTTFVDNLKATFSTESEESEKVKELEDKIKTLQKTIDDGDLITQQKLDEVENKYKKQLTGAKVKDAINQLVTDLGGKHPTDMAKAAKKVERLMKAEGIDDYTWEYDERRSDWVAKDSEGNNLKVDGGIVTLKTKVSENFDLYYDISPADPKPNGGLPPDKQEPKPAGEEAKDFKFEKFKGTAPKTIEEANALLDNPVTPNDVVGEIMSYVEKVLAPAAAAS